MHDQSIYQAIDELGTAFSEFKQAQDERVKSLEKKGAVDIVLQGKIDRL